MITTLLILLALTLVLTWVAVMVLWWHQSTETESVTLDRVAIKHIEKVIRLSRRSYYAGFLYSRRAFGWGNKTLAKVFVRIFPQASSAFQKHDVMTGLEHGPSSYFLHSISESKAEIPKPKIRRKKIVA